MSVVVKSQIFILHHKQIIDDIKRVIEPDSVVVEKDLSLIVVIGQGMGTVKGTFESVFYAMVSAKIKVRMIYQGADDLNVIIGVSDKDYVNAVKALYNYAILGKENRS